MATASDTLAADGRPLRLVQATAGDPPEALAAALGLPALDAVLLLAGGQAPDDAAQPPLQPRLVQLVGRGLVRAAHEVGALCIAPAADHGLVGLVGRAMLDAGRAPLLLGVAPAGQVQLHGDGTADSTRQPLAPGLTHLVLLPGTGAAPTLRSRIDLARSLAGGKPVLMVVIGGDVSTAGEVLQAVRRGWPVLVVAGSGGAADALARQWRTGQADADDPVLAEILADGRLTCITLGDRVGEAVETMARQVLRQSGGESVLRQAWCRFGALDLAANRLQVDFKRLQNSILVLGVAAVLLSILHTLLGEPPAGSPDPNWLLRKALWLVLILAPIASTLLIAATNRFKPGKRWVLMRAAGEAIKREIYLFRLHAQGHSVDNTREKALAKAVEDITRNLAQTEANTTALPVYAGPIPPLYATSAGDDGLGLLSTDQYVRLRLADQRSYYRNKTVRLEASHQRWQYLVLAAGALGTLLAAVGGAAVIWVTLSTALAAAAMAYLAYQQVETTLVSYNQTATDLDNILSWWTALAPEEQAMPEHIASLASHTEQVLGGEQAGWSQRMTDALEKLRGSDKPDGAATEAAAAPDADPAAVPPVVAPPAVVAPAAALAAAGAAATDPVKPDPTGTDPTGPDTAPDGNNAAAAAAALAEDDDLPTPGTGTAPAAARPPSPQ